MRLIDADAVYNKLIDCIDYLRKSDYDIYCGVGDEIQGTIEEQPTAYNLAKVVEQLEERTTFLKECTKYGNKDAEQQEKSYATMMMYEVAYLVDDLLEIVKGGRVDGN